MKLSVYAATVILVLAALPTQAQRGSERITCYRERNVISCPGYGDFNIRENYSNRWDNNYYNYDRRNDNRGNRYDDYAGLRAVNEIYIQVLGRKTDFDGARTYIQALNNGWTLARIHRDIAFFAEAQDVINQAYVDILRRNADSSGMETYKNSLANGEVLLMSGES